MDSQDTELIKIATLQGRYGLESRQAVYDRINGLDIKPVERGKISPQQLDLLDKLDKHIREGGAIANFPIHPEVEVPALEKLDNQLDILDNQLDNSENLTAITVMAGLVEKMMGYIGNQRTACSSASLSHLAEYEELEKAVTHQWILSTAKVKELIGVTPRVGKDEMTFVWGSFTFTKAGKLGNQMGWLVSKS
ncbi:hypothetical protein [Dolichospermum compactum]|uniref:Uncharacterized protein n=1 Tax=Dolichospermum compactum NIES-806 TaxID=1973481 RepID=A0A1Z4V5J9_9CYAN|nr:hypothetical protein [Dolichospermum compactum]BAZ86724.1 hypothetical protein NIES806_29400 [Dolichospermum compactum NIES-806]